MALDLPDRTQEIAALSAVSSNFVVGSATRWGVPSFVAIRREPAPRPRPPGPFLDALPLVYSPSLGAQMGAQIVDWNGGDLDRVREEVGETYPNGPSRQ